MMKNCLLVACAGILLVGCGAPNSNSASSGSTSKGASGSGKDQATEFSLHKVEDKAGTGKLVGTYLIPKDWKTSDTITWYSNNFLTPVIGRFKITSPDGLTQLDELSAMSVTFGHSPTGNFGMQPPQSVSAFLLQGWKQEHRGVAFSVIEKKDTQLKGSAFDGTGAERTWAQTGNLKLRYKKSGKVVVGKVYARLDVGMMAPRATGIGGTMYEGNWILSNAWTATAPEADLAGDMKLFGVILASYKVDPHFYNLIVQCQQVIQKNIYAGIRQAGEMSRIISQTNDQISDSIMQSYESHQAVQDHEVQNFDDYINGVQRYKDDDGTVGLPSNYNHAWSDGNGNYLMTEEHGWDPNVAGVSGTWHEMDPAN